MAHAVAAGVAKRLALRDAAPLPASSFADEVLAKIQGKGPSAVIAVLKELTKRGELDTVVRVLQECSKPTLEVICKRWRYANFLEAVALSLKTKPAILFAKLAVQHVPQPAKLLTAVLQTCAKCRDLDSGMTTIELARKYGLTVDAQHLTTLIKVCKSVGNVDKAYRVYLEMRAARLTIDGHVFGALIATCAEAMKRDLTVVHERKDQYVLLERAFHYVEDAEAAGVALQAPVWNALMVCAGRSGELNRAFEVLTMMQQRGVVAGATTYGSLIESCVCARQPEKALRVFEVAMAKGFVSEVKLYTQALSACMLPLPGAWERALEIYAALQRASVRPDKKFFACLMAVAGRCGRLDSAFELLSEMAAEGIRPSGTSVSALIHACMDRGNLGLARRVYDLCARQGVYPVVSQYNRMMDVYASECRFGDVVSLLCDMVAADRQPNLNTYRILINAATLTDQANLAFQIFALMHANRIQILQGKFAQTIYYMLVKACYNQTRFLWVSGGYPPARPDAAAAGVPSSQQPHSVAAAARAQQQQPGFNGNGAQHAAGPAGSLHVPQASGHHHLGLSMPAGRRAEADKVLEALGGHKLRRGVHQSNPFDSPADSIDWTSHALSAFHHMLSRGHKPSLEMLDLLLGCLRAKMLPPEASALGGAAPDAPAASQVLSPLVAVRSRDEVFELAFENRAFVVLEEAINRGLLPAYDPEAPLVLNMRRLPPSVAEVYVLYMLRTLERRSERRKAAAAESAMAGGGAGSGGSYHHSITLLVPPFDPDLVQWPSYLERLMNHYSAEMSTEVRAKLRYRNPLRRSRARRYGIMPSPAAKAAASAGSAAANAASDSEDEDAEGAGFEFGLPRSASAAGSSYDELEAAISGSDDDEVPDGAVTGGSGRDPWAHDDVYGWADEGVDFAGGRYLADSTTGLAVAATLRRMKVWMDMDYVNGTVTIFAVEVARWLKRRRQAAEAAASLVHRPTAGATPGADGPLVAREVGNSAPASALHVAAPGVIGAGAVLGGMAAGRLGGGRAGPMGRGAPVEQQQRNIRLGMMSTTPAAGASGPTGRPGSGATGHFGPGLQASSTMPQQQAYQQTGRGPTAGADEAGNGSGVSRSRQVGSGARAGQRPASEPSSAVVDSDAGAGSAQDGIASSQAQTLQSLAARLPTRSVGLDEEPAGPVLRRPGPQRAQSATYADASPTANGLVELANGANGHGGNGQEHAPQPRRGLAPGQPDAYVIAVPQQHVQVAMGTGVPVTLPMTPEAVASSAAATPAGSG
ncbi:hypothetical protein GPECTOR_14g78 [Gonium pectorale]|uniref:PROP1-like PPR domain-containing protein n=1 Tax=Gonium pectorale TaxID=33097 RepID=A0A150GMU8_GONPE|nr:hypothetical protein GPECTOR_14g78 [Gonium pectorale]|eukprot:KXZ51095.1 hypothetical protein GPECTOR_14g78 [Gonium pectorale]